MKRKTVSLSFKCAIVVFGLCLLMITPVLASTTVYYENLGELDGLIGAIGFSILSPTDIEISDFDATLPNGWLDMSFGNKFSAFDMTGAAGLMGSGTLGDFSVDVILGDWELGTQSAVVVPSELYKVIQNGTDYTISAVPIPSALLLFAGGLVGLIGIRRKTMN